MTIKTLKPGISIPPGRGLGDLSPGDFSVQYEEATIATWERNGPDDSDLLALVWTGEDLKAVEYASTSYWSYANAATVDASSEVKRLAAEWLRVRDIAGWTEQMLRPGALALPGFRVRVLKGRAVPIGTEGVVVERTRSRYPGAPDRCKICDDAGTEQWTAVVNVELVNADPDWTPEREIEARATAHAAWLLARGEERHWVSAYELRGGYAPLDGPGSYRLVGETRRQR